MNCRFMPLCQPKTLHNDTCQSQKKFQKSSYSKWPGHGPGLSHSSHLSWLQRTAPFRKNRSSLPTAQLLLANSCWFWGIMAPFANEACWFPVVTGRWQPASVRVGTNWGRFNRLMQISVWLQFQQTDTDVFPTIWTFFWSNLLVFQQHWLISSDWSAIVFYCFSVGPRHLEVSWNVRCSSWTVPVSISTKP